ncbi:hypothetical protein LTR09_003531 [Extremus antarcticus]|uniref:Metallo-beta-lactamase domain-containing protein n=1 Tax=Extremus antarcticus TaxID=702011 RepID=A0AAJ0GBD4_9PEZI|nr:hypothetical protein LTR09_003531 [Extremus antarcticus]
MSTAAKPSASFTTKRVNRSTFVIYEDDIYAGNDTGCDEPSEKHKHDRYVRLRQYLEECPVEDNDNKPLNPNCDQYFVILTHCHYDHIGGIGQFLPGGTTEIIMSSSGRDFVESDLETHGLFKYISKPVPWFKVTHWANSFERLKWPIWHDDEEPQPFQTEIGLSIIHTPGHTPDELAWYDHDEMHLSCGDSFYEEGEDGMPIIFPAEGNLIEWVFSMQKLLVFVRSENARAAAVAEKATENGWVQVAKRVKVSCAHQTTAADGEEILATLEKFAARVYNGDVPVVKKEVSHEEAYYTWREEDNESKMSIKAPARLMDDARRFFNLDVSQAGS